MGYYSDVSITIYKKDFEELCRELNNCIGEDADVKIRVKDMILNSRVFIHGKITTILFDQVKWYESNPCVSYLTNFIKKRDYSYKRVGEELGDVEVHDGDNDELWEQTTVYSYIDWGCAGDEICQDEIKMALSKSPHQENSPLEFSFDDAVSGATFEGGENND